MLTYLLFSTVLEFSHSKCQKSLYITTPLAFKSPDGDGDVARNPSMDRWIGEWCSYNFAAGSFHIKKLCSRVFSTSWILLAQTAISRFCATLWGTYNVHGSSMARWKARGRLPISANWTFFTSYHGWGTMSRYWSKLCCLKGGWVTLNANFRGKGASPTNDFWHQKESLGYRTVKKKLPKISTGCVGCTNVTDRQTDDRRQTELR